MTEIAPFSTPRRFLRGNLHTHTDRSDGTLPVEAVVARYREAGYDFLAVTDHFLDRFNVRCTNPPSPATGSDPG
ncbi:PHP domain-containing protein [Acuticoccus sp. M5D2P5]|uniref:PHP domain-containing protein n=1 Tax=Acuticoccus kalidii TaxID=2910977 RepID=UPI001F3C691C|nr:PHP domain-containing protein [Acuticoccus kalidii]MCF3935335.1 PHP domain-containing protein [Acuticoccus kalidii]